MCFRLFGTYYKPAAGEFPATGPYDAAYQQGSWWQEQIRPLTGLRSRASG